MAYRELISGPIWKLRHGERLFSKRSTHNEGSCSNYCYLPSVSKVFCQYMSSEKNETI